MRLEKQVGKRTFVAAGVAILFALLGFDLWSPKDSHNVSLTRDMIQHGLTGYTNIGRWTPMNGDLKAVVSKARVMNAVVKNVGVGSEIETEFNVEMALLNDKSLSITASVSSELKYNYGRIFLDPKSTDIPASTIKTIFDFAVNEFLDEHPIVGFGFDLDRGAEYRLSSIVIREPHITVTASPLRQKTAAIDVTPTSIFIIFLTICLAHISFGYIYDAFIREKLSSSSSIKEGT